MQWTEATPPGGSQGNQCCSGPEASSLTVTHNSLIINIKEELLMCPPSKHLLITSNLTVVLCLTLFLPGKNAGESGHVRNYPSTVHRMENPEITKCLPSVPRPGLPPSPRGRLGTMQKMHHNLHVQCDHHRHN